MATDACTTNSVGACAHQRRPIARFFHRCYKLTLSPFVGRSCRFFPTCSDYALEAIEKRGWCHGTWLAVKRVCRCHPYHPGGIDPVP